jgi:D-alanine-D-alanine ligase
VKKLRVAVLMGGISSEREVSLISGKGVFDNLDRKKYDPVLIDVPRELEKIKGCEMAFIALHGKGGEDGQIQGYLETLGIKYTGCGVLASAIGMDKKYFKELLVSKDILVPETVSKAPCVVKPVCGGSSVGVSIVEKNEDLAKAIQLAKKYDDEVIIEEYIKGVEVTCGVWGKDKMEALPVVEIIPKNKFFDYESKYSDGGAEEICPARLSEAMTKKVQGITVEVFKAIKGRGYARVDMIIKRKEVYVLDINTLPGLTPNSLLPKEARAVGMSYPQLLDRIIELAE